jgi:hypothetical protein
MFPSPQFTPSTVVYCDIAPVTDTEGFYNWVVANFHDPLDAICAVSPLIPMQSGGGWYAGRVSFSYDGASNRWWYEPYDRASDYYPSREDVEALLEAHQSRTTKH